MRFMIHGADQKTGRELTVVVDAPDETEAERRALYNDILVSSVAKFTAGAASFGPAPTTVIESSAPTCEYEPLEFTPEQRGSAPQPAAAKVPRYGDVLYGARWLDRLGLTARCAGAAGVIGAIAMIVIALSNPVRQALALPAYTNVYLLVGAMFAAIGILSILCGVIVSMMSGLVIAVRDIAQNTFHVASREAAGATSSTTTTTTMTVTELPLIELPAHTPPLVTTAWRGLPPVREVPALSQE